MLATLSPDKYISILAILFYGIAGLLSFSFWKNGLKGKIFPWILLPILAFITHTLSVTLRGIAINVCPMHTLFDAGIFVAWLLSVASLITICFSKTRYIGFSLYPLLFLLGTCVLVLDCLTENSSMINDTLSPWINLHITFALLAYASIVISAIVSTSYLIQQKLLKRKNAIVIHTLLPSLQKLETVNSVMLLHGLVFLGIGICIGIISLHSQHNSWILTDSKILWSFLLWVFITTVYIFFKINKLKGRKLAITVVAIFLYILATAWIASTYSHIHNEKLSAEKQSLNTQEAP